MNYYSNSLKMISKIFFFNFLIFVSCGSTLDPVLEDILKKSSPASFKVQMSKIATIKTNNSFSQQKIINGDVTSSRSFPFAVSLGLISPNMYVHQCGGSVLTNRHILSSASCFSDFGSNYDYRNYYRKHGTVLVAVAGVKNLNELDFLNLISLGSIFVINAIDINENFQSITDPSDLSILTVQRFITFSSDLFSIDIPLQFNDPTSLEGALLTTFGWGLTEFGKLSSQLLTTTLSILNGSPTQAECQSFEKDFFCAKDLSGKESNVCFGDSGGPLLLFENNKWTLYGVSSFAFADDNNRCINTAPSFFTIIPRYSSWINQRIL